MAIPTKYQYNEMMEKLEKAVELYDTKNYKYNEFKLYLSNAEVIEFKFYYNNIAHLLGININTLISSKMFTETRSYEILKGLIRKKDSIYEKCKNNYLNYDSIFSEYIEEKIDAFETVLKFEMNNILFACKYDKSRTYTTGEADAYGCDYYIALEDEEMKYIFLGLKQVKGKYFAPASVIVDFDKSNSVLKKVIENQQVVSVNELRLLNISKRFYLKNYDKLLLLQRLSTIVEANNSNLIVAGDLRYNLRLLLDNKDIVEGYEEFIAKLTRSVVSRKQFTSKMELPTEGCSELVKAYNLLELDNNDLDISETLSELKQLKKQLEEANKAIKEQEAKINYLESNNAIKEKQISDTEEELKNLRQFKEEAFQLVKKYN